MSAGNDISVLRSGWAFIRRERLKVRFAIAGCINTVVGLAMYPLILLTFGRFGLNYMAALVVSQCLCIMSAYLTTKYVAFRTRGRHLSEAVRFASFYLLLFAANLVVLPLLVAGAHVPPIPAQLGFSVVIMLGSYFWHSRITFGRREHAVEHPPATGRSAYLHRACPICSRDAGQVAAICSERHAEAMEFDELRPYWSGFFQERVYFSYARCSGCGLLFAPVFFDRAQLASLYESMRANMDAVPAAQLRRTQDGYFDILTARARLESGYLEIGPDIGLFTERCVREGKFDAYWLFEPNRAVTPRLEAVMGDRPHRIVHDMGDFSCVPDRSIGVGVLIHVLDHLVDPLDTLKDIREKLVPGGKVLIVAHNEASFLRHVCGRRWPAFCLQHPQIYSPESIRALLREAGYGNISVTATGNYFPIQFLLMQMLWTMGIKARSVPSFGGWSIGLKLGNIAAIATAG